MRGARRCYKIPFHRRERRDGLVSARHAVPLRLRDIYACFAVKDLLLSLVNRQCESEWSRINSEDLGADQFGCRGLIHRHRG